MEERKSGRRFTEEFKVEAVRQVTERGHPVAEVAALKCSSRSSTHFTGAPALRDARHIMTT